MKKVEEQNIQRQSNFEFLRILAIIMIIFHHIAVHGNFSNPDVTSYLFIVLMQMGGKIGVNIFILISGYFLIKSEKIKIKKILKLWGQMFFYSLLIYIIFCVLGLIEFEINSFTNALLPVLNETWWFATLYFILYLISPFLNMILRKIDKRIYSKIILLILITLCIIPIFECEGNTLNSLIWFMTLYSISAYIKLYGDNWKISSENCFIILVIISFITYCVVSIFYMTSTYLFAMESLPIFLISLLLFLGFKNSNIKDNKFINKIASTTFGIYLIHDNVYIRLFLWNYIFKLNIYENDIVLIPYSILSCMIVFVVCSLIDLIRKYTIEKVYIKFINELEKSTKYLFFNKSNK